MILIKLLMGERWGGGTTLARKRRSNQLSHELARTVAARIGSLLIIIIFFK